MEGALKDLSWFDATKPFRASCSEAPPVLTLTLSSAKGKGKDQAPGNEIDLQRRSARRSYSARRQAALAAGGIASHVMQRPFHLGSLLHDRTLFHHIWLWRNDPCP